MPSPVRRRLGVLVVGFAVAGFAAAGCEGAATDLGRPDAGGPAVPDAGGPTTSAPPDVKAPPADAKTTASGLAWKVLKAGQGTQHPGPTDEVTVHYTGWTTDGAQFDSSVARGVPATFKLNGVIKGWTEGVQLMVEGEKSRFWIPADLAYGTNPPAGYPAGLLVFDIELISIKR